MTMSFDDLPAPSWHGFPAWADMVRQWGAFVVNREVERVRTAPARTRRNLNQAKDNVRYYRGEVERARQRITESRERVQELRAQLTDPDPEAIAQQVAEIKALPFVLGTRLEPTGALAVLIRVTGEWNFQQVDIGDFDVALRDHRTRTTVSYIRPPRFVNSGECLEYDYLHGYRASASIEEIAGATTGYMPNIDAKVYSPAAYLQRVHDTLAGTTAEYWNFRATEPAPEPIWQGFLSDEQMTSAVAAHQRLSRANIESSLRRAERDLAEWETALPGYQENLREENFKQRAAQAAYDKAQVEAYAEVPVDPNRWEADLKKIATLPGVMGLKFNDWGIPVIHVRTSIAHDDKRYDMGDYELTLKQYSEEGGSAAVIVVESTRRDVRNFYYHRAEYGDQPWFCFGNRASQIESLFMAGEYPAMIHLMINCLNAVNSGDERRVRDRFQEIPMDAVWLNELHEAPAHQGEATEANTSDAPAENSELATVVTFAPLPPPHRQRRLRPRRRPNDPERRREMQLRMAQVAVRAAAL